MKKKIATWAIGLLLMAAAAIGLLGWRAEHERAARLELQLTELSKKEKRAVIEQSINKQMEEIAYEQKRISDERSDEAKKQADIAELEKQNAMVAQQEAEEQRKKAEENAEIAKENANEAKKLKDSADVQRDIANVQRDLAQRLSYLALGRSLGAMAYNQHQSGGNKELAARLAYASYWFTDTYGNENDLYHVSVIQALMDTSEGQRKWSHLHKGGVTGIGLMPEDENKLVTVSSYGEIFLHEMQGDNLKTTKLFANSGFDFRSVFVDESGTIFAVSRTGQLVIVKSDGKTEQKTLADIAHPSALEKFGDEVLAIIGERSIAFFNMKSHQQQGNLQLGHRITASGRINKHLLLFDERGAMHELVSFDKLETKATPAAIKGIVTAFAHSDEKGTNTYGTSDGKIYVEENGGKTKELVGHRSRITRLRFKGNQLYSSSYDGKMNLWLYEGEKVEPILLFESDESDAWIRYFTFDSPKTHVWTGDNNGNLTRTLISVPMMVNRLKGHLLSEEEWNNYVGKNAPYQQFVSNTKGGGK